jgi:transposase
MANILNLKDWTIGEVLEDGKDLIVQADYGPVPESCLKCGVVGKVYRHGKKVTDFRDAPVRGKPVIIRCERQRYRCQECGETFLQPLPDMDDNRRMTTRLVDYIGSQALRKPFTEIADEVGMDEKTIRLVAGQAMQAMESEYPVFAPHILGIDEVMVAGELRAIFTDLGNRTILDLISCRRKPSVAHWLSKMGSRERVQVVCIDMWPPYRDAARAVFGKHTTVVVDKFHVVRLADHGLDMCRKAAGRERNIRGRRQLMRSRHLLLKRKSRLNPMQQIELDGWLQNIPRLAEAHAVKEGFYALYDIEDRGDASRALKAWEKSLSDDMRTAFKPLLTAVGNWREEILAFWDHRVTNAYTEAMNGILKQINRRGRGYTFPVLRARILHGFQSEPPKGFNRCERCRQDFPKGKVHAKFPMPTDQVKLTPGAKAMRLCWDCHQSYISEWISDHGDPTRKSE